MAVLAGSKGKSIPRSNSNLPTQSRQGATEKKENSMAVIAGSKGKTPPRPKS